MLNKVKKKVLVAPLDWGLGHATRCIPIIHELLNAGFEVFIAAEGKIKLLLLGEFPYLTFLPLKGYNITYARHPVGMFFKIFFQIPKILSAIRNEQQWLQQTIRQHQIDLVLSDNRYGLYSNSVPCLFITHQLTIEASFFTDILRRINYRYINHFSECWVPDEETLPGLAGRLSHPLKKPVAPVTYIGCLSRFNKYAAGGEKHLLILLSGPEPQRTILEKKLTGELKDYTYPVLFVRGLPEKSEKIFLGENVVVSNHLDARQLEEAMLQSWMIIARTGYSTVMDIAKLQKRSILIPTPGQTEQEYLAKHLSATGFAYCVAQENFRLQQALAQAKTFAYKPYKTDIYALKQAINRLKNLWN